MATPKTRLLSGSNMLSIDYTTSPARVAGDVVTIGGVAAFAERDIAAGAKGSVYFSGGAYAGQKITGVMTLGDPLYWDSSGSPNTGTASSGAYTNVYASGLQKVGIVIATTLSGDDEVYFVKTDSFGVGIRMVGGQATTVTASDTIVTGLTKLVGAVATFDDNIIDDPEWVTASIGDQAGTPASGSFLLKTWKNTGGSDPTPAAATTFSKKVNWIAFGN